MRAGEFLQDCCSGTETGTIGERSKTTCWPRRPHILLPLEAAPWCSLPNWLLQIPPPRPVSYLLVGASESVWTPLPLSPQTVLCLLASHVQLFTTPWIVAHQASLSMGILQARILEWVAMPSSRGSSHPRDQTQVSHIAGRFSTIRATRKAL